VNGIRALLAKDPEIIDRVAREENADVVVLQAWAYTRPLFSSTYALGNF